MIDGSGERSSLTQVLDRDGIGRTLARMAAEILENDGDDLVLVGIHSRGVPLAQRLAEILKANTGREIPLGRIDISLYRDDVGPWRPAHSQPVLKRTELPFDLDEKVVYLVDDVLYTGRTIRAALDALVDYGRPRAVRLAVLIDRGHRELPIAADVVGKVIQTSRQEDVQVRLLEFDGEDGVWAGTEVADGD
ncbi:MAG: bifunctional pyr operon transcriptional regulator/uracil phosphoribosyltransferase PyrR [Acidobacteria bacterium]|nr:bifunctional pyr operon transcriptional regulator/uracil phosphoribosyltransferase PyrR [Acidobacteriota bacterium]